MSLIIEDRFARQTKFWDITDWDPSDLAVAVAGDICECRINPYDYLHFYGDWARLNFIRECLLLGYDISKIQDLNQEALVNKIDSTLKQIAPEHIVGDARSREYQLKIKCLVPFALCNQDTCLHIDHSTMYPFPNNMKELKEALMNHLNFYRYTPWFLNYLPGPIEY